MSVLNLTAVSLGKKIQAGELSAVEATQEVLAQVERVEKDVHSYVSYDGEAALKERKRFNS